MNLLLKAVFVGSFMCRILLGNQAFLNQLGKILIQRLHTNALSGLDSGIHLGNLGFTDQVSYRRGANHDFMGSYSTTTDFLNQCL